MWTSFIIASLLFVVLLEVPGFALCRILGMPHIWSLCIAPLPSIALIAIVGQVLALMGIAGNMPLIAGILAALLLLSWLLTHRIGLRFSLPTIPGIAVAIILVLCIALGYNLFLSRLDSPDALFQAYDVTQHLNFIQSMADSGRFSSLNMSPYASTADQAIEPFGESGFYPAAWHVLCALVVQMTSTPTMEVINASTFIFSCLIFPLGAIASLSLIFSSERETIISGVLATLAFVAFPWALIVFGPIFPNLVGFTVLPIAFALFIIICGPTRAAVDTHSEMQPSVGENAVARLLPTTVGERIRAGGLLLICIIGLVLLHPNTVFTCAVILIPYCVARIYEELGSRGISRLRGVLVCTSFCLVCLGIWTVCYRLPFLQDTVTHIWPDFLRPWQAIIQILSLSFTLGFFNEMATQYVLAAMVLIGIIRALHSPRLRWLPFSYAFASFIFVVSTTQHDEFKQFIAGFWYTDPMRIAAMITIAAIPLATLGIAWTYRMVLGIVKRYNKSTGKSTSSVKVAVLAGGCFLLLNYLPEFNLPGLHTSYSEEEAERYEELEYRDWPKNVHTTFGDYRDVVSETYSYEAPLTPEEQLFLQRVKELVPADNLIINDPMDGSFLAYGMYGIRTYYRNFIGYGTLNETEESVLIRMHLCDYADNPAVREAVDAVDAQYVLVMDQKNSAESFINLREDYKPEAFAGISSINSRTPGFTLIDHFGRIALYKIDR